MGKYCSEKHHLYIEVRKGVQACECGVKATALQLAMKGFEAEVLDQIAKAGGLKALRAREAEAAAKAKRDKKREKAMSLAAAHSGGTQRGYKAPKINQADAEAWWEVPLA